MRYQPVHLLTTCGKASSESCVLFASCQQFLAAVQRLPAHADEVHGRPETPFAMFASCQQFRAAAQRLPTFVYAVQDYSETPYHVGSGL